MRFQQFLDPWAYALQARGASLQNESQSLDNQIKFVKLGMAQEQLTATKEADREAAAAFQAYGNKSEQAPGIMPGSTAAKAGEDTPTSYSQPTGVLADFKNAANLNFDLAKIYRTTRPQQAASYMEKGIQALKDYQTASENAMKHREGIVKDLQIMAQQASASPTDQEIAIATMKQKHPDWDENSLFDPKSGFGFQKGASGRPQYDQRKWQGLAGTLISMKDKLEIEHKKKQEELTEQLRQVERAKLALTQREVSAREANHRDAADSKQKAEGEKFLEKEKKSLHGEGVYKDFDKYEMGLDTAKRTMDKLKATGGYENFTTSDAAALVAAANNMMQGYRSRYSGVKDMERMNKLNGMIRGMEKWAQSIGTGEKQLAYDTALEMTGTMNDLFYDRNKQVVRETLKRVQSTVKRGLDPEELEGKGDVKELIRRGDAKTETDQNGDTYIILKRPGTNDFSDRFLVKKRKEEE